MGAACRVTGNPAPGMSLAFAGGGIVAGVFLGWVHVHVLANMALLTVGGYRYVGAWAFFLNGTASAIATAVVSESRSACWRRASRFGWR